MVLRGAASQWPAAQWTMESLRERVGSAVVPVHTGRWKRAGWRITREGKTTPMRAADYLTDLLEGRATGYLAGFELLRAVPSLRADLVFPDTGPLTTDVVWIGPAGMSTPIHFDFVPNIYAQLAGQKRWRLWRPERSLQPKFAGLGGFAMSALDAGDGPDAAGPPDLDITLDAGDVLLLPSNWWHRVDTLTDSIAVNRWWSMDKVWKFFRKSPAIPTPKSNAAPNGQLRAVVVHLAEVSADLREAMWSVFERVYADVDRSRFEQDLTEKQDVILLFDEGNQSIQGFSTLRVYHRKIEGREVVVVYSGDTVIAPGYWGQRALHLAFLKYVTVCKARHPFVPVYWFLISKGYKTYLLLSRNYPEYWPRRDIPTPAWPAAVIKTLAAEKFGQFFDPERGVVRFDRPMGRVRAGMAPIEPEMLENPDVRFFIEKNPGHEAGDELCCLGRIGADLAAFYVRRRFQRAFARSSST
jgi:Cupin-like domain